MNEKIEKDGTGKLQNSADIAKTADSTAAACAQTPPDASSDRASRIVPAKITAITSSAHNTISLRNVREYWRIYRYILHALEAISTYVIAHTAVRRTCSARFLRNPNRHTATTTRLITQTASSWKKP